MYPNVGKPFHSVPGQTVQIAMAGAPFDIYLPPMFDADIQSLSAAEDTEIGFGDMAKSQLADLFPAIDSAMWDDVAVTFPVGSAQDDAGNPAT